MSDISEPEAPASEVPASEPAESPEPVEVSASDPAESPVSESETAESTEAEAPSDPYESYGGKDRVEAAIRLHDASQTEDGVIQLFLEAGRSLGIGNREIEALFTGQTPAPATAEPEEEEDPDRPLTVKEFQEAQAKRDSERAAETHQTAIAAAKETVHKTVESLGLTMDDPSTEAILRLGDKYLTRGSTDSKAVAEAVRRGHADYAALVEKESKAYLEKKKAAASNVPTSPSGASAPATAAPEEPKNTAEAIKIARKRLGISS